MSLIVKTVDGEVKTRFMDNFAPEQGVVIGEHEIPLEHFCYMAGHFLGGGWFGWGGKTPKCVSDTLTLLFKEYRRTRDGKWVRKSLKELLKKGG